MGKELDLFSRREFIFAASKAVAAGVFFSACREEEPEKPKHPSRASADTKPTFTPERYGSLRFLTLPFPTDPKMKIQQGWFYSWKDESGKPAKHQGIDFIRGEVDQSDTWEPFDVLSAADGWVCANPPLRLGNAVFITHLVNDRRFYTYYGHLGEIERGIPNYDAKKEFLGGVPIKRREKIGVAGATGVTNERGEPESTWIHLHFGAQDADGPLDPYDLHGERDIYPNPNSLNPENLGPHSMWK